MTTHVNFSVAVSALMGASIAAVPGEPAPGAALSGPSYFAVPTVFASRIVHSALYVRPGDVKGAAVSGTTAALVVTGPAPVVTITNVNALGIGQSNAGKRSKYSSTTSNMGGIEGDASPVSTNTTSITYQLQVRTKTAVNPATVSNQLAPAAGGPEGSENVAWANSGAPVTVAPGASATLPTLGPDQRVVIVEGTAFPAVPF